MRSPREIAQALSDSWFMRPLYPQEPFIADIAAAIEAEREAAKVLLEALETIAKTDTCCAETGPNAAWLTDWRNSTKLHAKEAIARYKELVK